MCSRASLILSFNSRPHEEVDSFPGYSGSCSAPFNSRPHEEVDATVAVFVSTTGVFQFTTSRGGRLPVGTSIIGKMFLSIHDLTRRSTLTRILCIVFIKLSIHDLTRRSTRNGLWNILPCFFQFTTSRGGRPGTDQDRQRRYNLSIHDLTRRSTHLRGVYYEYYNLSIHDLTRRSTIP